jgi:hypothetical protein
VKKRISLSLLFASLFFLFGFSAKGGDLGKADSPSPQIYLSALNEQDEKVPLYWFEPGSSPQEIFYDNGTKKLGVYANVEWFDNCLAVRITPPTAPFLLLRSKVFISYQGAPSNSFYNYKQPFFITINTDSGGIPGSPLTSPVLASAVGEDTAGHPGEWVEIEHNLLMLGQEDFWIVFHWKEGSPLSPLVGADSLPNHGRSYWGWRKNGYWEWSPRDANNVMIGAVVVANATGSLSSNLNMHSHQSTSVDSFRIYRGEKPGGLGSSGNFLIRLNPSDFNYIDESVENRKTYYYKISAWYGNQESDTSNEVSATPQKGAELWENKDSAVAFLKPNEDKVENLTLKNIGGIPLRFGTKINMFLDSSSKGTDDFGHVWTDSDKKGDLDFYWVSLQGKDSVISQSKDDSKNYGPIPLGFSFPFYGDTFNSLYINTNGWIGFNHLKLGDVNDSLPSPMGPFNLIAIFWDDFVVTDSSKISVFSNSDSFAVKYEKMARFAIGGSYTFQGILTKEGKITFQYLSFTGQLNSNTVGIQNKDASRSLLIAYNQDYVHDSLRIDIIPSWIDIVTGADSILAEDSLKLSLIFDSKLLNTGVYRANLIIEGEDKNHILNPLNIPLVLTVDTSTGVIEEEKQAIIQSFSVLQNYPNPFNPTTAIHFRVGSLDFREPIHTTLTIYNILGQRVKTLVDEDKLPGEYKVIWDGKDEAGKDVASGIYFYTLKAEGYVETKKMVMLK